MILLTLVIAILVLCYYIKYVYFTLHRAIAGLAPGFLFGNMLQTGILGQDVPMNTVFLQFKAKFGDVYQFWLGPTRIVVVSRLEDVQHIFAHRHVYDQGDIFAEKFGLVNPNGIIALKG
ncbi:unnamed protein product [Rotaria sp. Silwood2]|nr:unnamed protein product [Rotaria sp. Silwood2]